MLSEIARAVAERMWTLIGVLIGLVTWLQSQDVVVRRVALAAASLFALLFIVLSVIDGADIFKRNRLANELADRQRGAYKRYTEWWTFCHDAGKAAKAEQDSEDLRKEIIKLLQKRLGEAEAQEFNTPRAVEPFPSTTLVNCPQAVLINAWAHRIDRLGEIIQRLRAKKT